MTSPALLSSRLRLPLAAVALAATMALAGCASLNAPPVNPGDSEQQVVARLGRPSFVIPDGDARLLEYNAGPWGQYTYMARVGADGRLIAYQQVWTLQQFGRIQVGTSTRDDVLRLVGHPTEVTRYARIPYEAWNYGFKETGVWNSEMSVYFDDAGIVRKLENGPDPRFDHNRAAG